jgi:hypothetical protein
MLKTGLAIFLISIPLLFILIMSHIRTVFKGEKFVNPVFASSGNLFSDKGEYEGRAGYFSYFPFVSQYNSYLNNTMQQSPCSTDSDCYTSNCSSYGYCSAQYKRETQSSWGPNELV